MKLRLPQKLTAALIAAITTVAFALPQTYATVSWNGGVTRGDWFYTDNGKSGSVLTDDEHGQVNITAEGSNPVTAEISEVAIKDGATVRISGGNSRGRDRSFAALMIDDVKAGNGVGSIMLSTLPYRTGTNPANTTATVKSVTGTLSGVQNYGVLTLGTSGSTINASGIIVNNSGATLTLNGTYTFDTTDAMKYTLREEGSVSWTDEANKQGFKKSTGSTYYVIKGATEGTNFSVGTTGVKKESNGIYYFTAGEVIDHSKFYVNADTATLNQDFSGQLVINKADAKVTIDGVTFSGTITGDKKVNLVVQNGATLTLTGMTAFGSTDNTFTIGTGSTIDLNGQADGNYKYTLAGGTITNSGGSIGGTWSQTEALILTADSIVNAGSGHDFRLLGRQYAATSLDLGGKTLVKTGAGLFGLVNTTVTAGTIEVREGTLEFIEGETVYGSTASSSANITFNGGNATGGMNLTSDITLAAQQSVSTGVGINAQNHGLTLAGDADLTLTGTINNVKYITKSGTGTATITASGSLNKAIDVQAGTLVLNGSYAIDNIIGGGVKESYIGTDGQENADGGFYLQSGTKTVYTKAAEATLNLDHAVFTYGDNVVTDKVVNGSFIIPSGNPDYSTLYVNQNKVDYASHAAYAREKGGAITTVVMMDGATVDLGEDSTIANLQYAATGITVGIAGKGFITSFTDMGTLYLAEGASVSVPDMTVRDNQGVFSTGPGMLVVEKVGLNANASSIEFDSATTIGTAQITGGAITFGGNGVTHNVTNLKLSQDWSRDSTVNVEAGATLHITGTVVADTQPNRFAGSFSISHWDATNVVNVYGTLISEVVVSSCDGTGTINVENGGRLEMRDGLNRGNYRDNAITINVERGATLVAGTTHNTTQTKNSDTMVVNMAGGSTFEAYYGASDTTADINKVFTFSGGEVTFDSGSTGKTLRLNSGIIGESLSVSKTGLGTMSLTTPNNEIGGTLDVREGSLVLESGARLAAGKINLALGSTIAVQNQVEISAHNAQKEATSSSVGLSNSSVYGTNGKGTLENLSMSTSANYTIEDMSISGSLIDVGEGTTLYLVNVDIKSDTHITDEAAWLDMKATKGWLDKDNTQAVKEYATAQDTKLFKSGDAGRSITLAAGTEIVELTSDMFDTVTMTGTDLWLDMTGIAEATYNKDYFTLDFKNLAHSLENAQVDVDHLHVYATLDGERYTEAYSTANGGLTTTLYFSVPEPTTSTLSLLALAALAARRRKKDGRA